jgi:hypothetical protein
VKVRLALLALGASLLVLGAACGGEDDARNGGADGSGTPGATATPGRIVVDAPIDDAELIVRESFPPQYAVRVVVGLVDGCHEFDAVHVDRSGTTIEITATATTIDDPNAVCTAIYGTHEETVELGTGADYDEGVTYTVKAGNFVFTLVGTGGVTPEGG